MKLRTLGLLVAAPLAVMLAAPVSAETIALGTLGDVGPLDFVTEKASATPFDVIYTFTLPYTEQVLLSSDTATSSVKKGDINTGLTSGEFALFSGTPTGSLVDSSSFALDPFTGAYYASLLDTLAAGSYYIEVSGLFDPEKKSGSKYVVDTSAFIGEDGTYSVTAVPEVSTWGMMLLGFAGLGFAGYRSQRKMPNQLA